MIQGSALCYSIFFCAYNILFLTMQPICRNDAVAKAFDRVQTAVQRHVQLKSSAEACSLPLEAYIERVQTLCKNTGYVQCLRPFEQKVIRQHDLRQILHTAHGLAAGTVNKQQTLDKMLGMPLPLPQCLIVDSSSSPTVDLSMDTSAIQALKWSLPKSSEMQSISQVAGFSTNVPLPSVEIDLSGMCVALTNSEVVVAPQILQHDRLEPASIETGHQDPLLSTPPTWLSETIHMLKESFTGSSSLPSVLNGRRIAFCFPEEEATFTDFEGQTHVLSPGFHLGRVSEIVQQFDSEHSYYVRLLDTSAEDVGTRTERLEIVLDLEPQHRLTAIDHFLSLNLNQLQDSWIMLDLKEEESVVEDQEAPVSKKRKGT